MTGGSRSNVDSISSLDAEKSLIEDLCLEQGFKNLYSSSGMPFTSDQIEKLMSLIGDKPGNGIHANMAELNITVGHPNGTTAKIRKVGNLKLSSNIVLFDVLVIPEYCVSLLSVNKRARDSKLHVGFNEYDYILYHLGFEKQNILGTGSEAGGLYVFNTECKAWEFKSNNRFLCFNVSKGIWYNRLGHPSDQVMSVLKTRLKQSSDIDQESIQIGEEEDFSKGNNFEHFEALNLLFNTKESTGESNTLRRSSRQSKLPPKLNDYVPNSKTRYDLDKFVNHTWLSAENCSFVANVNKIFKPKSYEEAALDKNWVQAMNEETQALYENNTWDLVELPRNRRAIGSKWVYKTKLKSTGEIDRYKARLVAKWFNQKEGIDYEETFSPVVKIGTVRCLISLAVQNGWCLFQLDVNNAFLYGNLDEDAPKQWNNRLTEALIETGFQQSGHDHSLYTKESGGSFIALLVYVDDIVLTGNNINEINNVKKFLSSKFKIKDLGELKYFLGIEVLKTDKGGLCLLAKCHVTRRSVSGYCVFFNGCMVSWKSKKQATLSKSSAEAEYRSMTAATCELIWVVNILKYLKVTNLLPAKLFCDNSAAIQIAANPVMHEKTKHFDLDVHIIREKVASGLINTAKTDSENQTADIFTKALGFPQHNFLVKKLTLLNMYTKSV
ncbi:ribonuclease H-like domain-containing protein [Tanacetum coccineum]